MKIENSITLCNWYAQPIHCPFCGEAMEPDEGLSCKHLLYVIAAGNFISRTERFDQLLNEEFGESDGWPEFLTSDINQIGDPYEVANKIRNKFESVEFDIQTPTDGTFIGYAAFFEELCAFGKDHASPY